MGKQAVYGEAEMQRVVLSFRESGMSLRKFAKFCRIPESTMRRWVKMERPEKKARRTNRPKYPEVETEVRSWMDSEKERGHIVSTSEIQAKAKEIADEKGIEGFQGSNGWVYRLKHKRAPSAENQAQEEAVGETSAGETSTPADGVEKKKKKKKIAPHPAAASRRVVEKSRSRDGTSAKGNKNASKKHKAEKEKQKGKTKEKKEKRKKSSKKRSSPSTSSKYVVVKE